MSEIARSPEFLQWLANGARGVSSNTIAQHLTGVNCLRGWRGSIPWDPDDLDRCLQLLADVPALRPLLPNMATYSRQWADLVARWDEVEASHLEEVGLGWTKAHSAPKTYALMDRIRREGDAKAGGQPSCLREGQGE